LKKLKPEEDAFGQEMWVCYKGERSFEIVERDDGYFDAFFPSPSLHFSEYDNWHPVEKKAMEFGKGRVLDVGCGAGRHSLHLQKKGFDVFGIDNSPLAVKVCRLRGVEKAEVLAVEDVDFSPSSFDTIIMMGNNFGLFGGFKKARRLLKKFHKMTSEKGLIIASTRDPYKTDNPDHLEYHKLNKEKGRMGGQLKIRVRFRKYVGRWFDYLIASKREMESILQGTGWKIREYIDSNNSEYIAIIEKDI